MKTASDIDREAAAWIARRDASNGSTAVSEELQAWIEADVHHRAAFLRMNALWERTRLVERLRPLAGPIDKDLLAPTEHRERRRRARWFSAVGLSAVAAALLLGVGTTLWFLVAPLRGDVYSTGVGEFERVRLDDGSQIELNTDSKVRVRITEERRLVFLTRGEANFKVAHDARRPFDVAAGASLVRAVGTEFSVRLRGQKAEVLVTEGRVVIAPPDFEPQQIAAYMPTLSAGEVAIAEPARLNVQQVRADDMSRRLAWTQGKLVFEGETLERAVAEFNRYNRQQLIVADPALANLHVGGSFAATDLPSFIAALERVFDVRARTTTPTAVHLVAGDAPAQAERKSLTEM